MSFPSIRSSNAALYNGGTSIAYPPTIVAGDILLMIGISTDPAAEAGWTLVSSAYNGSSFYIKVQYKIATGSESGSLTLGTSFYGGWMAAIANNGQAPEASTAYATNVDTPTPPSLSPSAGTQDYLWFAYGFQSLGFNAASVPGPWSLLTKDQAGAGAVVVGYYPQNGTTITPTALTDTDFTLGNAYSATVAVRLPLQSPLFFGSNF